MEECVVGLLVLIILSIPFFIYYPLHKEKKMSHKQVENIKVGDIYKAEWVSRNPFEPNIISLVKIEEIKYNNYNIPWVKYSTIEEIPQIKTEELCIFLISYKYFEVLK